MGAVIALRGNPHPKQVEFFLADARYIGYGGARGGGKSWALRRKMVLRRLKYPGSKGLLLRRTYPELYQNHVLPLLEELHGLAKYRHQDHVFEFPNGSRLFLGYCDSEKDVLRYQGQEYDDIGMEEATQFTEYQFQFLKTCNRTTRTDLKPRMYLTANPGGVGHSWFKRLFLDRQYREGENPDDYMFIRARVFDNPTLMQNNPEYVQQLMSLPDDLRRAFLDGDWNVFSDQVFTEFSQEVHVVTPFAIPDWWRRWIANDPGYAEHFAWYWFAADHDGNVYVYREYTNAEGERIPYSQQAAKVAELSRGEQIDFVVVGLDAFNKHPETGKSIVDYYREGGLEFPIVEAIHGPQSRRQRTAIMHEYLKVQQDPNEAGRFTARLRIFSTCKKLIETLPALTADEKDPEVVSKSSLDHWYDACSYGLCAWHAEQSPAPPQEKKEMPWPLRTDYEATAGRKAWWKW